MSNIFIRLYGYKERHGIHPINIKKLLIAGWILLHCRLMIVYCWLY